MAEFEIFLGRDILLHNAIYKISEYIAKENLNYVLYTLFAVFINSLTALFR